MQLINALNQKFGEHFAVENGRLVVEFQGHQFTITKTFAETLLATCADIVGVVYEIGYRDGTQFTQGM